MIRALKYIVFLFLNIQLVFAQNQAAGVTMTVENDQNYQQHRIISKIIKIKNRTDNDFAGYLSVALPQGLRSISGDSIRVFSPKGDSTFVPVRMIETGSAPAGRALITLRLLDQDKRLLRQQTTSVQVEEDNTLKLQIDNPSVYIFDNRDSVKVKVRVENPGNKTQFVTVVFGIPDQNGQKVFIERKKTVGMKSEEEFVLGLVPNSYIIRQENVPLSVTVLKGSQKAPVASAIVTLHSVQSSRSYNPPESMFWGFSQSNSLTASFRQIGSFTNAFQLLGQGNINLPIGNLELVGNLYKSNTQQELVATNTAVSYQLDQHRLTLGSINEVMEYSLFGRGTSLTIADSEMKKSVKVGFVDANYNLTSGLPLLINGYSVFAIGKIGNDNMGKEHRLNVLFRESPIENASHTIVGGEGRRYFNTNWSAHYQVNVGTSRYREEGLTKPSFSSALQYNGKLKDLRLNGNYYFSTDYFPGNRRGTAQINQGIHKDLSNGFNLWANVFYMNLKPRYFHYSSDLKTHNLLTNVGIGFPKRKNTSVSIGYQSQSEFTNTYRFFVDDSSEPMLSSKANRGTMMLNWISPNFRNLISVQSEAGAAKFSTSEELKRQLKVNSTYTYKWFNLNLNYQLGSYFLSEHISSLHYGREFERLALMANFTSNTPKWQLNGGLGYSKDHVMGSTPSAIANIKYLGNHKYQLYLNSSWYRYRFHSFPTRDLVSVETGVTYNFKQNTPSSARKGKLKVLLFLDSNANGKRDPGESPAKGYYVNLGTSSFITDETGHFTYSLIPFNTYKISPIKEAGWFYEGGNVIVSKLTAQVEIPLKQMGTVAGEIAYKFDSQRSQQFEPRISGIYFNILQGTKIVNRVSTNDLGQFLEFLPTGRYQIELDQTSLAENTFCSNASQTFEISSGHITELIPFEIGVINRKVNIKRFGD